MKQELPASGEEGWRVRAGVVLNIYRHRVSRFLSTRAPSPESPTPDWGSEVLSLEGVSCSGALNASVNSISIDMGATVE
jgi:hypothetical protein